MTCNGDDEIAPQRGAAIAIDLGLAGIHGPHDRAAGAGAHVDLVNDAPGVGHVHKAIVDQRRGEQVLVAAFLAKRDRGCKAQVLDVGPIDL